MLVCQKSVSPYTSTGKDGFMNTIFKKFVVFAVCASIALTAFAGCGSEQPVETPTTNSDKIYYENEISVVLDEKKVTAKLGDSDVYGKNVFVSNDVIYYEDMDKYESGNPYGEGKDADKHTAAEAAAVNVVNITEPGYYRISGKMSQGQIRVDLGEDAKENEEAVVTLILDGVELNCDVAPAVVFMNVYECDGLWDTETATSNIDTTNAGANVIVADGSVNNIEGAYVAKIFKDKEGEKKLWKQDGAFYSYMSMNIDGEKNGSGVLNIMADNEGLGSELHLTINGGNINIFSDNDGINTNEDGVSVTTINGGNLHIIAGLGAEGDGIDSNGWLVINGGTVISSAKPISDAGLDSDMGSFVNGGTVVALGSTMDWAESDSEQVTMNLQFDNYKTGDSAIIVAKEDGTVVFAYDPSEDEVVGTNTRQFMGAVVSCPDFAVGDSYNVYIGAVTGTETNGIYDVATITTVDAVQQAYTGTDVRGFGGFGGGRPPMGGNFAPGQFGDGTMPQFGEGFDPSQFGGEMPEGMTPPGTNGPNMPMDENFDPSQFTDNMPDNFDPSQFGGNMPQMPEGGEFATDSNGNPIGFGGEGNFDFGGERPQMGEGFDPSQFGDGNMPQMGGRPEGTDSADRLLASTVFYMQDKVNNFSGVDDFVVK